MPAAGSTPDTKASAGAMSRTEAVDLEGFGCPPAREADRRGPLTEAIPGAPTPGVIAIASVGSGESPRLPVDDPRHIDARSRPETRRKRSAQCRTWMDRTPAPRRPRLRGICHQPSRLCSTGREAERLADGVGSHPMCRCREGGIGRPGCGRPASVAHDRRSSRPPCRRGARGGRRTRRR